VGLREAEHVPASLLIAPVAELGKFADFDYKKRLESYINHTYNTDQWRHFIIITI